MIMIATATYAGATNNAWQFSITPNLWGPSVSGNLGIGDVSTDVDLPIDDILKNHLDLAGMINMEARKNRWGILVNGDYLKISIDKETPGPFFNSIDTTISLSMLDVGLAYRVIEADSGWLDVLVGGRYMNLTAQLDMKPDYEAVDEISSVFMDKAVTVVRDGLEDRVDSKSGKIAEELADLTDNVGDAARDKIRDQVNGKIDERVDQIIERVDEIRDNISSIPPRQLEKIKEAIQEKLDSITDAQRDAIAEAVKKRIDENIDQIKGDANAIKEEIKKAAEEKISELKRNASAKVKKALDAAEAQLASAIQEGMTQAANADIEETKEWVDPYVGLRGRLNMTQRVYLGARADIGGFGIGSGSELTWQVFGGVGIRMTKNTDFEAGWRYMSIDYENGAFNMDLALSGVVVGVRFIF